MTVCVSIRRQPFNTHGHGHEHEVWTQNLPTLPCHWPQDMKFPWKNVTAVPAVSSFGTSPAPGTGQNTGTPAWLRGRRQHPGCSGRREEGAPLLQSGAMSRALQRFFLPRSRRSAGSLSDAMGRCGAAAARASPTSENPSFHHYRLSVRPSATAGTAQHSTAPHGSFHWNPLLLAIYILFLERDRKPNESEPSMVTSAPALTRLSAVPVP